VTSGHIDGTTTTQLLGLTLYDRDVERPSLWLGALLPLAGYVHCFVPAQNQTKSSCSCSDHMTPDEKRQEQKIVQAKISVSVSLSLCLSVSHIQRHGN